MFEDGTESCPDGHYSYTFSYGNNEETYNPDGNGMVALHLAWGYNEPAEQSRARRELVEKFLEYVNESVSRQKQEKERG